MAVTLYRVFAGRLPFHDARGKSAVFVLDKHIFNEPTLLTEAAAGADIPPAIAAVIESALRKDPNDRPPTMRAFAEALRAAATSPAPSAPAIVARYRRRPYELLLGLGLGIVVTWMATPRPARAGADDRREVIHDLRARKPRSQRLEVADVAEHDLGAEVAQQRRLRVARHHDGTNLPPVRTQRPTQLKADLTGRAGHYMDPARVRQNRNGIRTRRWRG